MSNRVQIKGNTGNWMLVYTEKCFGIFPNRSVEERINDAIRITCGIEHNSTGTTKSRECNEEVEVTIQIGHDLELLKAVFELFPTETLFLMGLDDIRCIAPEFFYRVIRLDNQ